MSHNARVIQVSIGQLKMPSSELLQLDSIARQMMWSQDSKGAGLCAASDHYCCVPP